MKTHLDLYGWEITRNRYHAGLFCLRVRGFVGDYAGGTPDFIRKVIEGLSC